MPPPDPPAGTAQAWLSRAKGKLELARQPLPQGAYLEDLCFLAQQAAELAIKAVYLQNGWRFPYIHDLGQLLDGLTTQGLIISSEVEAADQLSLYAAQTRYPGLGTPVNKAEYQEC